MSEWPDHHCPVCGVTRKPFARYPWHLCNDCRDAAVDAQGRALRFFNTHASGGFGFAIEGDDAQYTCRGVIALVAHRQVYVTEARFGGTVAQPYINVQRTDTGLADLSSKVNPPKNLEVWNPKTGM